LSAVAAHPLPNLSSERFELCSKNSFDALSKRAITFAVVQEAYLGCALSECFSVDAATIDCDYFVEWSQSIVASSTITAAL
jgi:hypothetical protein